MIYELAGLRVAINNRCKYTERFCENYLSADQTSPTDLEVAVTNEEFYEEKKQSEGFSDGYIENICLYRAICRKLPVLNRMLLHAAVLEYDGKGYAFLGRSGTGKSTSIKAIVNKYYESGLRMIEIYKHQFKDLSAVISQIKNRNYRFIIYMDDLSFEENETEYKYLKAIIEGGVETRPDNVLIYATSNRRHLIRESFRDKNDAEYRDDVHHCETVEEKLSLVNRFGLTIGYMKPSRLEFDNIVLSLARKEAAITLSDEEILAKAHAWELRHGGISGRTAQQFVNYLSGNN